MKKQLCILFSFLLLCLFCNAAAFAQEGLSVGITLDLPATATENGTFLGKTFTATVRLDVEDAVAMEAGGLVAVQFGLQFDANVLQPADPETGAALEFFDTGEPTVGRLYLFGTVGSESQFSALWNEQEDLIVCTYLSSSSADTDIFTGGEMATFAFRVREDVAVTEAMQTPVSIVKPYVSGVNQEAGLHVTGNSVNAKVLVPFSFGYLGDCTQDSSLLISVSQYIGKSSDYPLTLSVTRDGAEVEEPVSVPFDSIFYQHTLTLDAEKYEPGSYKITLSHHNAALHKFFNVAEKMPAPTPTPTPAPSESEPDDPAAEPSPSPTPAETPAPSTPPAETPEPTPSASPELTPSTTPEPSPTSAPSTGTGTGSRPSTGSSLVGTENPDENNPVTPAPAETESALEVAYPTDTANHWADANIKYVYDHALMNGYSDGTFRPGNSITRAEFSTVMARFLGLQQNAPAAAQFADCTTHWARGYIGALAEKGIVGGVSDTAFSPDSTITREQIAVILSRAFGLTAADPQKYADDADISSWAYDGVYSVRTAGYMQGDANGCFLPRAGATRAEVATIMCRLHKNK